MNGYAWALIVVYVLSALASVGTVGQRREPRTPTDAVIGVVIMGVLSFVVYKAATV